MEFTIQKKGGFNEPNYSPEDHRLAKHFSDAIKRELGTEFLKAVALFGSGARGHKQEDTFQEHDIDILLIINDLTIVLSQEAISAYRVIVEQTATKVTKRLHITTLKLTNFWEYVRNGDPLIINILRDGVVLYDSGFFLPLQALLYQGRIRPTKESIWTYYARAPATIKNSEWHVLQATLDLYWAVIDAAHAALMNVGEIPPTPEHVSDLISKKLAAKGLVPKRAANIMEFFYKLSKQITHRQLPSITGKNYDLYKKEAEQFVAQMKKVVENK